MFMFYVYVPITWRQTWLYWIQLNWFLFQNVRIQSYFVYYYEIWNQTNLLPFAFYISFSFSLPLFFFLSFFLILFLFSLPQFPQNIFTELAIFRCFHLWNGVINIKSLNINRFFALIILRERWRFKIHDVVIFISIV